MVHIHLLVICALVGSLYAGTCPDNRPCNGVCCRRFPVLRQYWCCKPGKKCVSNYMIGACANVVDAEVVDVLDKARNMVGKRLAEEEMADNIAAMQEAPDCGYI